MAVVVNVKNSLFASFYILFLLVCSVLGGNYDTCEKKGPCRCEYYNGTIVDISKTNHNNIYSTTTIVPFQSGDKNGSSLFYFYFHPCSNTNFSSVIDSSVPNMCTSSSICMRNIRLIKNNTAYIPEDVQDDKYISRGSIENVNFASGSNALSMVYNDLPSTTTIVLVCSHNQNVLTVTNPDPKNTVLTFFSEAVCAFEENNQHSFGTTLVIIFLVLVLVYLLLGALVKHFLMGAQGAEVIPNITFWRDLPNLVRDGIDFIKNGFKAPPQAGSSSSGAAPNPNSYDSI